MTAKASSIKLHGSAWVYTRNMASECICATLRVAARKMTARYDAALAPIGINLAQFSLLRNINRAGLVSLTELGRKVELDRVDPSGRTCACSSVWAWCRSRRAPISVRRPWLWPKPGRDVLRAGRTALGRGAGTGSRAISGLTGVTQLRHSA